MYVLDLQRTFMIAHNTKKYYNAVANMCVVVPLPCQTLSHLVIFRWVVSVFSASSFSYAANH